MATKKKDLWLVPDTDTRSAIIPQPPSGSDMTYEERRALEKFRGNSAEEILKGVETLQAGQIANGINRQFIADGVDMIEFGYAIKREGARDADEQKTVDAFLGRAVPKALQDGLNIADTGTRGIQQTLARPLTPEPRKKRPWER